MRVTPTYTAQIPVYMNKLAVKPTFLSVSPTQSLLDKPLGFFPHPQAYQQRHIFISQEYRPGRKIIFFGRKHQLVQVVA